MFRQEGSFRWTQTFSGLVSIPVRAEGCEHCLMTKRRKLPNELLCAAVLSLRQQTFRRGSKRICCSAAAAEEVQASGQDALRKPQPGTVFHDSEADLGLTKDLVWDSLFTTHTQIIVAYLMHQKCNHTPPLVILSAWLFSEVLYLPRNSNKALFPRLFSSPFCSSDESFPAV